MSKQDIKEYIRQVAENNSRDLTVAKVVAVNGRECEVQPLDGSAAMKHVRLNADIKGDQGIVVEPAKGSVVLVAHISENDHVVVMCSEVERVKVVVGQSSYEIKDDVILFNDGDNDGVVNIKPLVKKLNALEDDLNSLKNLFKTWVPAPSDGGTALKTLVSTWFSKTLSKTTKSSIEDVKVKH